MLRILILQIPGQLRLPNIPILKQLLLIIIQLLLHLPRKLMILTQNDRINRTSLLAIAAINTLCHVYVIPNSSPTPVRPLLSLDSDGICRAGGLAQLAGYASLFPGRVSSQGMLPSEHGTDRRLFKGVVYGPFRLDCCQKTHEDSMVK